MQPQSKNTLCNLADEVNANVNNEMYFLFLLEYQIACSETDFFVLPMKDDLNQSLGLGKI